MVLDDRKQWPELLYFYIPTAGTKSDTLVFCRLSRAQPDKDVWKTLPAGIDQQVSRIGLTAAVAGGHESDATGTGSRASLGWNKREWHTRDSCIREQPSKWNAIGTMSLGNITDFVMSPS